MLILGRRLYHRFVRRYPDSRIPLSRWESITVSAKWRSLVDVRQSFNSADYVHGFVVFNIGGNNYRLIADISYGTETVRIIEIVTHHEYSRWQP